MEKLPEPTNDPRVLVGYNTADDAGVMRINDELALVHTVDFFTPIVDDPFIYGQIAAANSLSDIYAMGGEPFSALNIVGFPKDDFAIDVLTDILRGGREKAGEAGVVILGGHTIGDDEMKYGLAVTGFVHPQQILSNAAAKADDVLVLTKPIGTGAIATALKKGDADQTAVNAAVKTMARLNKTASACCRQVGVHAVTDVTGFGLLGHALEMAKASGVGLVLNFKDIPVLPGAVQAVKKGAVPGGTKANFLHTAPDVDYAPSLTQEDQWLLNDPQTSGGLLIAVPEGGAERLLRLLSEKGVDASAIGFVTDAPAGRITVQSL